jgi:hypothetical protein
MNIQGLSNNYYLFKNKINILINGFTSDVRYLDLLFTNLYTNKISKLRLYPINNVFKLDISHAVENTFNQPNFFDTPNINLNSIKIDFKAKLIDNSEITQSISKYFIRGGNFQGIYPDILQRENYLKNGDIINYLISEKIPKWGSTPFFFNQIRTGSFTENIQTTPILEEFEVPCKGIQLVFLNQYGTYSQWYFNNYEIETSTKKTDFLERFDINFNGNIGQDLGVKAETTLTVKDRIPLRYNELIRHLIASPEIYAIENNFFRKLKQNNSKWSFNSRENYYDYKIDFDYFEVINPSELC